MNSEYRYGDRLSKAFRKRGKEIMEEEIILKWTIFFVALIVLWVVGGILFAHLFS